MLQADGHERRSLTARNNQGTGSLGGPVRGGLPGVYMGGLIEDNGGMKKSLRNGLGVSVHAARLSGGVFRAE